MNTSTLLPVWAFATAATAMALSAPAQASPGTCDQQLLAETKSSFRQMRQAYIEAPETVDETAFRQAALDYMAVAQGCHAQQAALKGGHQMIDQGGMFLGDRGAETDFGSGEYVSTGTKWGAGSPYAGGTDVPGPRLPGGVVTYSFMGDNVSIDAELEEGTLDSVALESLPTFSACFLDEIDLALAAWSAVADVQFVHVADGGGAFNLEPNADIRIGAHAMDGPSGTLAHAYFPPPNGLYAAGDTHFDSDEIWSCEGELGSFNIGIVALHEFGHALGLSHELTDIAVMNPSYNPTLTFGPLADDIIGIGELYDTSGAATRTFFGNVGFGTDQPQERIHLLDGLLLVEDSNTEAAPRTLFKLENAGNTKFEISEQSTGSNWAFTNSGQDFRVSLQGSGQVEFAVSNAGDATIANDLSVNNDVYVGGDLYTNVLLPSDRASKQNFESVDANTILSKVAALPVTTWEYAKKPGVRHIGPMAQDFGAAFGLGQDEAAISVVDASGIALASIQALAAQNRQLEARNAELEERLRLVEAALSGLLPKTSQNSR